MSIVLVPPDPNVIYTVTLSPELEAIVAKQDNSILERYLRRKAEAEKEEKQKEKKNIFLVIAIVFVVALMLK